MRVGLLAIFLSVVTSGTVTVAGVIDREEALRVEAAALLAEADAASEALLETIIALSEQANSDPQVDFHDLMPLQQTLLRLDAAQANTELALERLGGPERPSEYTRRELIRSLEALRRRMVGAQRMLASDSNVHISKEDP